MSKYDTIELIAALISRANSTKQLKGMFSDVCNNWCKRGCYCNPDRCPISRAYKERMVNAIALDEYNENLVKAANATKKARWANTSHRPETKKVFGSIKRSITCLQKIETNPERMAALDRAMGFAEKYNKQGVKNIALKYNFSKLMNVLGIKEV